MELFFKELYHLKMAEHSFMLSPLKFYHYTTLRKTKKIKQFKK